MKNSRNSKEKWRTNWARKSRYLDRGSEYLSDDLYDLLRSCGITLLDMVCSMMTRDTLPISLWAYALEMKAYILNLVPTKKGENTPFEMWK